MVSSWVEIRISVITSETEHLFMSVLAILDPLLKILSHFSIGELKKKLVCGVFYFLDKKPLWILQVSILCLGLEIKILMVCFNVEKF